MTSLILMTRALFPRPPVDQPRPQEVILPMQDERPFWLRYEGELAGLLLVVAIVAGLVLA